MSRFTSCVYCIIASLILGCHASVPNNVKLTAVVDKIAIASLGTDDAYQEYSALFTETLLTELANARKLKLVERNQIDKALKELGFQEIGLIDPTTASEVGKFVGAKYIFVGTFKFNPAGDEMFTINVRLINVEKGNIINGWSVDTRKKDIPKTARAAADRILRELVTALYPRPYTPASATFASTLVPGSGQLLNKRKSGYVFLPTGLLSAIGVTLTQVVLANAQDEQYSALKKSEYQLLGEDVKDKRVVRNIALGVACAVWFLNSIDTYLESRTALQTYYRTLEKQQPK